MCAPQSHAERNPTRYNVITYYRGSGTHTHYNVLCIYYTECVLLYIYIYLYTWYNVIRTVYIYDFYYVHIILVAFKRLTAENTPPLIEFVYDYHRRRFPEIRSCFVDGLSAIVNIRFLSPDNREWVPIDRPYAYIRVM